MGWGFCLNLAPKKPCRKVKSNREEVLQYVLYSLFALYYLAVGACTVFSTGPFTLGLSFFENRSITVGRRLGWPDILSGLCRHRNLLIPRGACVFLVDSRALGFRQLRVSNLS